MTYDVFMAGFGGQGILMGGNLLACAAMLEGKNTCYFPAYGVEKRGGAATCTVIVSDEEVGSPVIGHPGSALFFNQLSLEKYLPRIREGGFCLINSSLARNDPSFRRDIELLALPLNQLAQETGDLRLVNMVALGAYVERSGIVASESLKEALREVLPERNHRFIPMNIAALDRGAAEARAALSASGSSEP